MSIPGSLTPLFNTGAGGYQIERSLRFNSSDSAYLARTPGTAGNRKTWTWAGWVKRSYLNSSGATYQQLFTAGSSGVVRDVFFFDTDTDDTLAFYSVGSGFGAGTLLFKTNAVFRDVSAWYHIVLAVDTTQATAANRIRLYVNGVEQTFSTANYPSPNSDGLINSVIGHGIGRDQGSADQYFNGYLAECYLIDGQALTPSSFTEVSATTGQLIPKTYAGTYGFVSVAAATGALPVFNTTDTYGAVKGTGTRTDTNSAYSVLALPMDGTNGGTSFGDQSAVIKGSGSAKTITANGNAQTSTALSKFYGSSGYFDGTGDYLQTPYATDFNFGSGDFTIETFVNISALGTGKTIANYIAPTAVTGNDLGWIFAINTSNQLEGVLYNGSSAVGLIQTGSLVTGKWYHAAYVRSGTNFYMFLDGVLIGTASGSTAHNVNTGWNISIGYGHSAGTQFMNGYLQDLRIYKGAAKYTSNFSPVVSLVNSFQLKFADNSSNTAATLGKDTSGNGNDWTVNNISASDGSVLSASGALPIYNTTGTYGDTQSGGLRSDANAAYLSLATALGDSGGLDLVDQNVSGRTSSIKTITNAGAVAASTAHQFYGGSARFTGSSNSYASVASSSDFAFGTGDFTIEFWVKSEATNTNPSFFRRFFTTGSDAAASVQLGHIISTSGNVVYYTNTTVLQSSTNILNSWCHVALTRSSGTVRLFINGTLESSGTDTNNKTNSTLSIGCYNNSNDGRMQGELQDLRIYKGLAKYTSSFSVPSRTLAAGNDSLVDTPTSYGTDTGVGGEVRGNYCTLNPLAAFGSPVLSNGNLDFKASGNSYQNSTLTQYFPASGKWYWECTLNALESGAGNQQFAIGDTPASGAAGFTSSFLVYAMYVDASYKYAVSGVTPTNLSIASAAGDVVQFAYDATTGKFWAGANGTWFLSGSPSSGSNPLYTFSSIVQRTFAIIHYGTNGSTSLNAGARPFAYTAPSGFKALCDTNLAEGTITTSGTFTGNASADGPFVYLNGVPTAMTINSNSVTFGTHADKLSNGFKVRNSTSTYNVSGSNTFSVSTTGAKFKFSRAQPNP